MAGSKAYAEREAARNKLRQQATEFLAGEYAPTWADIDEADSVERLRAIAAALRLALDRELGIE